MQLSSCNWAHATQPIGFLPATDDLWDVGQEAEIYCFLFLEIPNPSNSKVKLLRMEALLPSPLPSPLWTDWRCHKQLMCTVHYSCYLLWCISDETGFVMDRRGDVGCGVKFVPRAAAWTVAEGFVACKYRKLNLQKAIRHFPVYARRGPLLVVVQEKISKPTQRTIC